MKIRNSFTISQPQAGVQASSKIGFHPTVTCEHKYYYDLLLPPDFITENDSIWCRILFLSVRVNCPGCVPSQFPVHSSLVGWCEEWKMPWLCLSTAQQQLKHLSVINSVFSNYCCNCYKSLYFYYKYSRNYTYTYVYIYIKNNKIITWYV